MAEQQAAAVQTQVNQWVTQVQPLTAEFQDKRQRETSLRERLNQVAQQQAQIRTEANLGPLVEAIDESQKHVAATLLKAKKLTLIDDRGVQSRIISLEARTKGSCVGRSELKVYLVGVS